MAGDDVPVVEDSLCLVAVKILLAVHLPLIAKDVPEVVGVAVEEEGEEGEDDDGGGGRRRRRRI